MSASPDQFSPEWLSGATDTRTTVFTFGGGGGRETTIGKLDFCNNSRCGGETELGTRMSKYRDTGQDVAQEMEGK